MDSHYSVSNGGASYLLTRKRRRLSDKVAVITGGARGIGAATAKAFAVNGAHVVIADIIDELGSDLAAKIGGRYIHCDVSVERDIERAVELAVAWKGHLDIMFNNAGVGGSIGSINDLETEDLAALLAVNLNGVVYGIKHASRAMVAGKVPGSIISSSSTAAIMGGLAAHAYTMSKAAILGVGRTAACELGSYGIRVNCISPHGVASEMMIDATRMALRNPNLQAEDIVKVAGEKGSLLRGRVATAEDVANAVVFLASEEARFITGHNLVIDGGYTAATNTLNFIYHKLNN